MNRGNMKNILDCTGHKLKILNIIDSNGVYLFNAYGKRYMDLESGIWCTSLGHKNIRISNVIKKQLDSIMHAGFCYTIEIVDNAVKSILSVTGFKDGRCEFLSSGSEAVEILRQAASYITTRCLVAITEVRCSEGRNPPKKFLQLLGMF